MSQSAETRTRTAVHSRVHDLGSDRGRSAAPFSRQRITGALSAGGMLGRRLPIDSGRFRDVRGE